MLNIESVNHIGIRIRDKNVSVTFYQALGFEFISDAGFNDLSGNSFIRKVPHGTSSLHIQIEVISTLRHFIYRIFTVIGMGNKMRLNHIAFLTFAVAVVG